MTETPRPLIAGNWKMNGLKASMAELGAIAQGAGDLWRKADLLVCPPPTLLFTPAAVVVGASVILFDPIFQGLALSLMAGEVASLLLSRMAVPILYYLSRAYEKPHDVGVSPQIVAE